MQKWDKHREKKKQRLSALRDKSSIATNTIPLELLAQDWLTDQQPSNELRTYLIDNLLPSVVVGLEKLLTEVSDQGLVDDKEDNSDFNPINYLAQHLMRNNPSHSSFSESHSYYKAMKVVSEKLRNVAVTVDNGEDLEQLKSDIKKHRLERESAELAVAMETQRREELLRSACSKWSVPGKNGINSAEVGFAIHSWLEQMSSHPLDSSLISFSDPLPRNSKGLVSEESLVTTLLERGASMSGKLMDGLTDHLTVCGIERLRRVHKNHRETLLTGVFDSCDPDKTGFVDRSRILHLFNCFYNSASSEVQDKLHNPRKWPIVEVVEAEELEDDEERRSASLTVLSLSDQDYQEFLTRQGGSSSPFSNDNTGEVSKEPSSANGEDKKEGDSSPLDRATSDSTVDKKIQEGTNEEAVGHDGSSSEVSREMPPLRSQASSVIEKRLATAGVYGRSEPISAQRRLSGMACLVSPSGPGSMWNHFLLTRSQFVQLVELFLTSPGPTLPDPVLEALATFIHENYTETAQERSERLELAEQQRLILTRRQRVSSLFEVWDNDGSGYLELEELQLVLGRWKDFNSEQAQEHAKEILVSLGASRLSRGAFQVYIEGLTEDMDLTEFEEFADYLLTSVKLTFEDVRRGEVRRGLLDKMMLAGKASGLKFSTALKSAIQAINEDNEQFGGGKSCSSAMAVLDGTANVLVFKAASSDVSARVVTRKLLRSFKQGVSFKAVDSVRPVCVANIRKHGEVYFFIPEHNQEEFNGSLVVAPIVTPREEVVGVVSVDSLREVVDDELDTTFSTHEINFYQGVGVCLGEVYHWIETRRKLLTVSQSALSWVHRRCPQVSQSALYIVEPSLDTQTCALRCMLTTSGPSNQSTTSSLLTREDNIFRDYLFQCADISEAVMATAYGQHHLAYPIRDSTGCAVAVLDLYMPPTQELRPSQTREVTKVLKLLTLAYYKLSSVTDRPTTTGESNRPDTTGAQYGVRLTDDHVSVLFDQLMLTDLKHSVSKLDNKVFAEMRSYIDPSPTILYTVQSLLYILHPHLDFETWTKCKQFITLSLLKDLQEFDPLSQEDQPHKRLDLVKQLTSGIGSVQEQGSVPAKYIYSWVSVCLSLLEHAACSRLSHPSTAYSQPSPPSTSTTVNTEMQEQN